MLVENFFKVELDVTAWVSRACNSSLSPPLVNQTGNQPCPSGLMAGPQTLAGVPVIVLVEEKVVAPMRVSLKFLAISETRSLAVLITRKDSDHALGNFFGHHSSRNCLFSVGRFQGKVRAERIVETQ